MRLVSFSGSGAAPRVLLINDDVSVSDMFCRSLRLDGFEVWGALSAGEGLALAAKHRPQAVILDLRMPLGSVLDVVKICVNPRPDSHPGRTGDRRLLCQRRNRLRGSVRSARTCASSRSGSGSWSTWRASSSTLRSRSERRPDYLRVITLS